MSPHYRDQVPLDLSNDVGKELRSLLSYHYSRSADIEAVLRQAGVSPATINWHQPVALVWQQVLTTLAKQGKLRILLQNLIDGPDVALADRLRELMADQAAKDPVIAAHVDDPQSWATIKYVDGPSLAQTVQKYGPLPPESVRTLGVGLAEALSAIHAAGIIHRDLSPSNILLAEDGPRLIDFGIGRSIDVNSDGLATIGIPEYMAPELATGQPASSSSDVFSLGAVLVYAATGEGPFGHGSPVSVLARLVQEPPRLDRVPDVLRPVIEHTLAKDPASRPSAAQLLKMLASPSPSPDRRSPAPSSEAAQEEPAEDAPRPGTQEESEPPAQPQEKQTPPRSLWHTVVPPRVAPETVSRDCEQGTPDSPSSQVRWLRKLAFRVFGSMLPPAALAVLQSDQEALQEEALRFIEAEIDRAYSALGPPPGLEGSLSGGRFDVERD